LVAAILPDIDGVELCRQLKAVPALSGSLVVLVSAIRTSSEDQALGLESGADGYIVQPTPRREFLAWVKTYLRLQGALVERDAAAESRYRAVSELASDYAYAFRIEPDGGLASEWVTGALNRVTGYSPRELQALGGWENLIHPEDKTIALDQLQALLSNEAKTVEYRIVTKEGRIRWMRDCARPTWNEAQDRVTRIEGAVQDITDRVMAERATRERHRYLESVLSAAPDAIVTLDSQNRIVDWNSGAEQLFGYQRHDVVGQELDPLIARGDAMEEATAYSLLVLGGETLPPTETVRYQQDGAPVNVVVAGAPIMMDGEVVGVVGIYTDITERKITEEALRQRASQLALLTEIGQQVAAFLDLDRLLERTAKLVQERFGYHHVGLFTKVAGEDRLVMRARAGEFAPLFPADHSVTLEQGMVGWVGLHGETRLANDVSAEPLYTNYYPDRLPTCSELSVPIRIGDEIVGVLDLQSPQPDAFDHSDVTTLETLAGQIGVAVHNARLFKTERVARQQAEKLQAATQALSATLDLQQVLEGILTALRHVVPYDSASVQRLQENRLKIIGGHGFPNLEELLGVEFDLTAEDNPNSEVVRSKMVLILDDAPARFEAFLREPHAQAGIRAWLGVPLFFGDRLIGIIALDKQEPGFYTEEHARLAQAFAAQAAIAIENARLFHETQRRNRELTLLNRVIAATATAGEALEPILEVICQELALAFEVPHTAAALFDEEKTEAIVVVEYRVHEGLPTLGDGVPGMDMPAFQHFLTHKAPLIIENPMDDPHRVPMPDLMRQSRTFSLLLLPLMVDGEVVGSLGINAVEPRAFSTEEVNLAWRVAEQVSSVVTRVRLWKERRQLEEQFHQSQKMEAVGRLAGGVAHDFNNLLTVIHLSARLLERALFPEDPIWPHVQRIQDAGERASNLTRQLLAFSRREIVELQVLSLNKVLGDLHMMLKRLISEDIELSTRLADDLWPVEIDPTQVEQVVVNLAVNAGDAMPGGGLLAIETANVVLDEAYAAHHLEVEPGEYVMLVVSDTGAGMSDEVKARLFEPFFTTKERGKGTGLGLATVFGIVKQNRGHIGVHSQPGEGTTFEVYLPRAKGGVVPSDRSSAYLEASALGSETLLVVEDETQVRELMRDILVAQGYEVLTAQDGVAALQVAQQHEGPIHLLISDVVMPRMSGRALADQLRAMRPEIRVLFTSGYTDDAILRHGVLDKGTDFLAKPFELETLARRVRSVLDAKT
jgi:PAS domain S-box-containing protein